MDRNVLFGFRDRTTVSPTRATALIFPPDSASPSTWLMLIHVAPLW
jgi:hypothetical protein